jgi:hypothetical protein
MNVEELINKNKILEEENKELKEKLKKYTAPARHKKYYENHKNEVLARNNAYHVPLEKKKEYARTAYLNKKEKLKKKKEEKETSMEENI